MRTTFELPDALMSIISEKAASESRSMKSVVVEALDLGLHRKAGTVGRWTCQSFPLGAGAIDYTKAWAVVDNLDADAVAEKLERRQ